MKNYRKADEGIRKLKCHLFALCESRNGLGAAAEHRLRGRWTVRRKNWRDSPGIRHGVL